MNTAKFAKELGIFLTPQMWRTLCSYLLANEICDMIDILFGVDDDTNVQVRLKGRAEMFLCTMESQHRQAMKACIVEERERQQVLKRQGEAMADDANDRLARLAELEKELETESPDEN